MTNRRSFEAELLAPRISSTLDFATRRVGSRYNMCRSTYCIVTSTPKQKCAVASTLNYKVCCIVQCRSDLCRSVLCRSILCRSVLYTQFLSSEISIAPVSLSCGQLRAPDFFSCIQVITTSTLPEFNRVPVVCS